MKLILCAGLILSLSVPSSATSLLLQDVTVHVGDGRRLEHQSVRVNHGRIESLSQNTNQTAEKVLKLTGLHLYPGLIALGSSLGLVEIEGVRATRDQSEVGEFTPDVQSWSSINPDSELLAVARANGIAYAEATPQGGYVPGTSGLFALDGWTPEQMTLKGPAALHAYWPSHSINPLAKADARNPSGWKSPEDQHREREERVRHLSEFFADAQAYSRLNHSRVKPPAFQAMLPVFRRDIPLAIHAEDARQIEAALKFADAFEVRLILYGGRDAWTLAEELAKRKVPVVYEHVHTLPPRDSDAFDVQYRAPSVLTQAGVELSLSLGGRFEAASLRNLPYAVSQAMAFGLTETDGLRAITLNPARVMRLSDRIGSIEPGKFATFFASTGPLFDIRSQIKHMWIAGREVSLENRHTRLYEKYRQRPPPP